jgi:hypothetical protein
MLSIYHVCHANDYRKYKLCLLCLLYLFRSYLCKNPGDASHTWAPFKDPLLFSETESGTEEPVTPLGPVAGTLCQEQIVLFVYKSTV